MSTTNFIDEGILNVSISARVGVLVVRLLHSACAATLQQGSKYRTQTMSFNGLTYDCFVLCKVVCVQLRSLEALHWSSATTLWRWTGTKKAHSLSCRSKITYLTSIAISASVSAGTNGAAGEGARAAQEEQRAAGALQRKGPNHCHSPG